MAKKLIRTSRGNLVLGLVVAVILVLLFMPARGRDNPISRGFLSLATGGHQFIKSISERVSSVWTDYISLVGAKEENYRLRDEVVRLKEADTRVIELNMENARLRQLLGFKAKTPLKTLPAQVVSRDPTNWFKTVLINKGKDNGINNKAAVVTHAGLVGHIIERSDSAAKVLLISDHASRVAVLIQRTRVEGILAGEGKATLHIEYLSRLANVQVGDIVISSGLGGVFPKGLKLGEVIAVEKQDHGLFQSVEIAPSADLSRLEEVLVLQSG